MILIDINVYSRSNIGDVIAINIMKQASRILIPSVVIGELKAGFLGGNKLELNNEVLDKFLTDSKVEIVDSSIKTTNYYAELTLHARKCGKALSNNDVWIAAIARENDCRLVTFDKDFEVFSELFGDNLLILSL